MNISTLTLRDLEYLVAVDEENHFGKAALKCRISQPALSGQIRKTEDFLGVQIFERTNRRVATTPLGRKIIAQARMVLAEAQKIATIAKGESAPLSGEFRLGAIATLGPYYIPHLLSPLKKAYPGLQLHLFEGLTDDLLARLKKGELDAVLASPTFPPQGLRLLPLFFEPFFLLAPKGHALAKAPKVRSSDLRASEMVLLEDGHCLKGQAVEICPPKRRGNVRQLHVTSLETLKSLVAAGQGYTLMPALAVRPDPRFKDLLQYRSIEGRAVGREIVLVCRESFARMNDAEELARFTRARVPKGVVKAA